MLDEVLRLAEARGDRGVEARALRAIWVRSRAAPSTRRSCTPAGRSRSRSPSASPAPGRISPSTPVCVRPTGRFFRASARARIGSSRLPHRGWLPRSRPARQGRRLVCEAASGPLGGHMHTSPRRLSSAAVMSGPASDAPKVGRGHRSSGGTASVNVRCARRSGGAVVTCNNASHSAPEISDSFHAFLRRSDSQSGKSLLHCDQGPGAACARDPPVGSRCRSPGDTTR